MIYEEPNRDKADPTSSGLKTKLNTACARKCRPRCCPEDWLSF
jgi:hypothetical protein